MPPRIQDQKKLLDRAQAAKRESKYVEFKSQLDLGAPGAWCELIKDIVAFANSGGGVILVGVNNDGSLSNADIQPILKLGSAELANKVRRYTGCDYPEIEIATVDRQHTNVAAFVISGCEIPIIFTKPGTYEVTPQQQRTAFSQGTLYFRHGAKSEPGTKDDLVKWRDKEIDRCRGQWLKGIRKVIKSPVGHAVSVVSLPRESAPDQLAITAQITPDVGATRIIPQNAEEVWPYRQKDLLRAVNREIRPARISSYDLTCVKAELDPLHKHPEFAYKPHRLASPQYSIEFARWLITQFKTDPSFFVRMRQSYRNRLRTDVTA